MLRIGLLRRYVLAELRTPTLLAIALWSSLLLMNQFFFVARLAIQKDLDIATVARLIVLYIPQTLVMAIPMGTLLGTMLAIGRLSADHELVAMNGAGLGVRFLLGPVLAHGLASAALALLVYGFVQPWAIYEVRTMQYAFMASANVASDLKPRVFFDRIPGKVLFVDEIRPGTTGELEGVLLYEGRPSRGREQIILARRASVRTAGSGGSGATLDLVDGVVHDFNSGAPESYRASSFARYVPEALTTTPGQSASQRPQKSVGEMSPSELAAEIERARLEPDVILRPIRETMAGIEAHKRLALPLACLVFAVLALPLGITRTRSGKGAGFALSLLIIVVYWLIFTTGQAQSTRGRLAPSIAVWTANLVAAVWAAAALYRMRRRRESLHLLRGAARFASRLPSLVRRRKEMPPPATNSLEILDPSIRTTTGGRWIARIDLYIGKLYLRMTALALAFACLLFVLIELKGLLDAILQRNQPVALIPSYLLAFLPGTLALAIPFACLIGAVVTFALLGRTGELTALKAAGVSVRRASAPVLALTAFLCAASFAVQDQITPETNRKAQEIKDQLLGRSPRTYRISPEGRWTFGRDGRLYHYRLYDAERQKFQGLSVFKIDFGAPQIAWHRHASSATWAGSAWTFENGWERRFGPNGGAGTFARFESGSFADLDPPANFARREATLAHGNDLPELMGLADLADQIESLSKSGYDTTRLRVAWHTKLSQPLTPFVMVLLGLPFAFPIGRKGTLYGVGVALILAIFYWAVVAVANALGLETVLLPALSAWAPNLLFAGIGTYFLLRTRT